MDRRILLSPNYAAHILQISAQTKPSIQLHRSVELLTTSNSFFIFLHTLSESAHIPTGYQCALM